MSRAPMGARDFWGLYLKRSSSALSYLWVHGRVRAWSTSIVKMSKDELLSGVRLTFLCASCGLPGFAQAIRKESELYRNTFSKTVSVVISSNRLTALAEVAMVSTPIPCVMRSSFVWRCPTEPSRTAVPWSLGAVPVLSALRSSNHLRTCPALFGPLLPCRAGG